MVIHNSDTIFDIKSVFIEIFNCRLGVFTYIVFGPIFYDKNARILKGLYECCKNQFYVVHYAFQYNNGCFKFEFKIVLKKNFKEAEEKNSKKRFYLNEGVDKNALPIFYSAVSRRRVDSIINFNELLRCCIWSKVGLCRKVDS